MGLSNKSESFRKFMLDKELKTKYSQSMHRAVKAIARLEKEQDIKYKEKMIKIRQEALELCCPKFVTFIISSLKKKKTLDRIWNRVDYNHVGYVESEQDICKAIWTVAMIYDGKKKLKGTKKKVDNTRIKQKCQLIGLWVCKKHGIKVDGMYKYKVSKREFKEKLPLWIGQYAQESPGTIEREKILMELKQGVGIKKDFDVLG